MVTFRFRNREKYNEARAILVEMLNNNQIDSMGVNGVTLNLNVFTEEHRESFISALNDHGINHKDYVIDNQT